MASKVSFFCLVEGILVLGLVEVGKKFLKRICEDPQLSDKVEMGGSRVENPAVHCKEHAAAALYEAEALAHAAMLT
eukprot:1410895-Amphidinium_carterae.1